jgi:hypothetical protein
LFLERNRVRRDDDALVLFHRVFDGGEQVRERFADAGPRFDK